MERDAMIGCAVVAGALGFITFIVLWCRRSIHRRAAADRTLLGALGVGGAKASSGEIHFDPCG